jgi:NAD(P)-dependent dehydrogenase (short-subunit alcohol dehydrogenase family)
MQGIDGKVAIVTGAGSGIGRQSALTLAEAGASVAVADINLAGAKETVSLVEAAGGTALAVEADVSDEASVKAMVDTTVGHFGSLQLLHNNAADVVIIQRDFDVVTMDVGVGPHHAGQPAWTDARLQARDPAHDRGGWRRHRHTYRCRGSSATSSCAYSVSCIDSLRVTWPDVRRKHRANAWHPAS